MAREIQTAEEIQKIVQDLIDRTEEVRKDGAKIGVPIPYKHETDEGGCNWNMKFFQNATGYESTIRKIVSWARSQFNLPK